MDIESLIRGAAGPVVIAHRGASFYHRENTIAAFEAALAMHPDMLEFDVRRSADGVLVVHHDRDFAGSPIPELTEAQIGKGSGSAGYAVPTFAEALECCKGKVLLDVELKEAGYEEQVVEMALEGAGSGQFLISSEHDKAIRRVKDLRPEIRTGLILHRGPFSACLRGLFPSARIERSGADVAVVSEGLIRSGFLRFNARLGKPVWVFTVNERKRMWKYFCDPRIGGIFTDRPDVGLFLRDLYAVGKTVKGKDEG